MMESTTSATVRSGLVLRGKRLEYFTIVWSCLEGMVGVIAGILSGSILLAGFGIDSLIEVTSGVALLWRMAQDSRGIHRDRAERLALRVVGACFLGLAAYVCLEATFTLIHRAAPERSLAGIALAIASLFVMPFLARAKRKIAAQLGSAAMAGDSRQTEFCAYLSAILLTGLLLNAGFGLWWADPAAAMIMVPIIANEGVEALRGKSCGHCA